MIGIQDHSLYAVRIKRKDSSLVETTSVIDCLSVKEQGHRIKKEDVQRQGCSKTLPYLLGSVDTTSTLVM